MITVADVMRHSGGTPWFLKNGQPGDPIVGKTQADFTILDYVGLNDTPLLDKTIEGCMRQPEGEGAVRCYHSLSRGCVVDGILRRVDPAKRGMVQFIAEDICAPLGVTEYRPAIPEAEQKAFNFADIGAPDSFFPINMEFGPSLMG